MYCEECKQRPATVHLTQIVNGQKKEIHLCEECAAKKGLFMFDIGKKFSIPNLLGSLFGNTYDMQGGKSQSQITSCPNCGMRFADIRQTGRLGCAECYTAFEQELEPTLRRVHGNSQHIGKIPARGGKDVLFKKNLQDLKNMLQKAVAREEYEKAAEIRDKIKELEQKME